MYEAVVRYKVSEFREHCTHLDSLMFEERFRGHDSQGAQLGTGLGMSEIMVVS